jgi:uncharacterized membrane protein YccC
LGSIDLMKSAGTMRTQLVSLARRMDWMRGLRAAVALCAPLVLGYLSGIPNLGWAALGGFEAILADTGGPYRSRLSSLTMLSLGGAAGLFLGSIVGGNLLWAFPVTVLWCFLWSYLAVLGQPFSSAGLLVQVIFICGVGTPVTSWRVALGWALMLLAGGAWAALLSLFLWPLDAYRPARIAVAECYSELASFLGSVADLAGRQQQRAALWHRLAQHHQYRIRRAVEHGWQVVAGIRAKRQAETARGRQLVVLLEHADLLIARTVALAEHFEADAGAGHSACLDRKLSGLDHLLAAEIWIATLLSRRSRETPATARAKILEMEQLPRALEDCLNTDAPKGRFLLAQVAEAASLLEGSIEASALLRLGKMPNHVAIPQAASSSHFAYVYERLANLRQGWRLESLRANFSPQSLILRHAARVALVCGLDVAMIQLLHLDHGYWLLLTSLIVLQPHVSGTLRRGMERIAGTVCGGILAAVLAVAFHSQMATAAVLFPLALMALAILPVSYAAFAFFLTPTFVLAWLPYSGDWQLALVRTVNTIAGALISILAMVFLFPAYERSRTPHFLRNSLAADRRYLVVLAEIWRSRSRSSRRLADARRATGLAHNDTEESLERLLAESWPRRLPFAHFATTFVTYLRRFAQSVTTLSALDGEWQWKQSGMVQSRMQLLDLRLAWLEDHTGVTAGGALSSAPWPQPGVREMHLQGPDENHPGERQLERMERQVEILYRQLRSLREHGWLPGANHP